MSKVEVIHERLGLIGERLSSIAGGIADQSGKADAAASGGSAADFPSVPEGQAIAKEWNDVRSLTSRVVGLLSEAVHTQGTNVHQTSAAYQSTDGDNAEAIDVTGTWM